MNIRSATLRPPLVYWNYTSNRIRWTPPHPNFVIPLPKNYWVLLFEHAQFTFPDNIETAVYEKGHGGGRNGLSSLFQSPLQAVSNFSNSPCLVGVKAVELEADSRKFSIFYSSTPRSTALAGVLFNQQCHHSLSSPFTHSWELLIFFQLTASGIWDLVQAASDFSWKNKHTYAQFA